MVRIQYPDRRPRTQSAHRSGWPGPLQTIEVDELDLRGRAASPDRDVESDTAWWDVLRVQARPLDPRPDQRAVPQEEVTGPRGPGVETRQGMERATSSRGG